MVLLGLLFSSAPGLTLTASAQATPVIVDFEASADTYVCDFPGFFVNGTGTQQFAQVLHVGTSNCHAFYRFDLSSVFQGSTVLSANLSLFQAAYVWATASDEQNVSALGTAVGWDEQVLTNSVWERDPRDHPVAGVIRATNNATTLTRVDWNVTPLVDTWVQLVLPNHGFRLTRSTGDGTTNFATREAVNTSWRPFLRVRYIPVVPDDPTAHPLADLIAELGIPVELFLAALGVAILVLIYFGIYAAHNPELVGSRKRQRPSFRRFWRRR